ncbi:MAG: ABC transporter permease [Oscillospiraceae bacterium]|nr:ABC transporter permease [Oscillospiraceae bacterium]
MNIAAYFASLSLPNLVSRLPGGVAQGIIWGIMALGVYITFRLLDVADLTVDGSFTTGGAVTAMLILAGWPAWAALLVAVLAGLLAGLVTGLLHTKLGIPAILAGILTQFALYSIDLRIMGMSANKPVNPDRYRLLLTLRHIPSAILVGLILAAALIAILYWYFGTEQGSALRATGSNPAMSRAQGININSMKVLGLSLSNGVVALSGGLMAQYQGFADINMGRGAIVIGLAAVIIGEVLCDAIFRKGCSFHTRLSFVVLGGVVYYIVMVIILWLRLDSNDLKLFTAVLVAVFLAVPYLQAQRRSSFKLAGKRSALTQGGQKGAQ